MEVLLGVVFLIIGILLVIIGGDGFVDASINLGKKLHIPSIIVGATFVSVATTLPELLVSTISASNGVYGMAVGNAMGSVICNTLLICGLSIAILPTILTVKTSNLKFVLLILSVMSVILLGFDGNINVWESVVILLIFVASLVQNIVEAIKESKETTINESYVEAYNDAQDENSNVEIDNNIKVRLNSKISTFCSKNIWLIIVMFIVSGGILVGGAELLIYGAEIVCKSLGVSDALIGVTIVAIGTSLPELVTTITAIKKKTASLGYGNIIGANIIDITLIMSLCGLFSGSEGLPITKQNLYFDFLIAILGSLLFVLPIMFKNRTYKWQGITMLVLYFVFFVLTIVFEFVKVF